MVVADICYVECEEYGAEGEYRETMHGDRTCLGIRGEEIAGYAVGLFDSVSLTFKLYMICQSEIWYRKSIFRSVRLCMFQVLWV